ncbi:hypothetical protein JAAARDRAFT_50347 [Jaapia argillacea MUCL 33604]|uniref:Uncharacterized protein n=1 Tax=Jaapia argillacea MUCL 33604 TaxID=933084 RepID=A0A067PM44_9AGAM|nr:hypothetical protein JAAARDRAFT_50347 [Jaapia argillacea MUCL 33604]
MLALSKPLPLRVSGSPGTAKQIRNLQTVLEHMGRIDSLTISASAEDLANLPLRAPAPTLKELYLFNESRTTIHPLSPDSFSGETLHLRVVYLIRCAPEWIHPTFLSNLVKLHISFGPNDIDARPPMDHMIGILLGCPLLEVLQLYHSVPNLTPVARPPRVRDTSTTVSLPNLAELLLIGLLRDCAALMGRLVYPRTAALTLGCTFCTFNNLPEILSHVTSHYGSDSVIPLRALSVIIGSDPREHRACAITGWSNLISDRIPVHAPAQVDVWLSGDELLASSNASRVLTLLINTINRSQLQAIRLYEMSEISVDDIRKYPFR